MTYDLTTKEGIKNASEWFDKYGWSVNIYAWVLKKLIGAINPVNKHPSSENFQNVFSE